MKAVAFLLLCSCAPAALEAPSSLPFLRIDPELEGPVLSREAAEIVAERRANDRIAANHALLDEQIRSEYFKAEIKDLKETADKNKWWASWGPVVLVIAIPIVGAAALVTGIVVGGRIQHE